MKIDLNNVSRATLVNMVEDLNASIEKIQRDHKDYLAVAKMARDGFQADLASALDHKHELQSKVDELYKRCNEGTMQHDKELSAEVIRACDAVDLAAEWKRKYDQLLKVSQPKFQLGATEEQIKKQVCQSLCDIAKELGTKSDARLVLGIVGEQGYKVMAIKAWRALTGDDLKPAKNAIDNWRKEWVLDEYI